MRTGCWEGGNWLAKFILWLVRSWPFPRGKSGVGRVLTRIWFGGWLPVRNEGNARLAIDVTDYIGQQICQNGYFEPLSLALAKEIMKDGGWFVDVGCNFGLYTCSVGVLENVRVVAIDPSPRALSQLERNLKLNPQTCCICVHVALAAAAGLVDFSVPGEQNLGTGRISTINTSHGKQRSMVAAFPASTVLSSAACGPVRLLKIDAEGSESLVFRGWDWAGEHRPQHIICEYLNHGTFSNGCDATFEFLKSKGYQPHTLTGVPWEPSQHLPEDNLWWKLYQEGKKGGDLGQPD